MDEEKKRKELLDKRKKEAEDEKKNKIEQVSATILLTLAQRE